LTLTNHHHQYLTETAWRSYSVADADDDDIAPVSITVGLLTDVTDDMKGRW